MSDLILVTPGQIARKKGLPIEKQAPLSGQSLGIGYLGSYVEEQGFSVTLVDGYQQNSPINALVNTVLDSLSDKSVLGLSIANASVPACKELIALIRAKHFSGPIILGGWEASLASREVLSFITHADALIRGEGEAPLAQFMQLFQSHTQINSIPTHLLNAIPGFVYRRDGQICYSTTLPSRPNLNDLPYPKRTHTEAGALLPIQGSRGCAYGLCTFCTTPALDGKSWRMRKPEHVIDELIWVSENYNTDRFIFVDDEFLGPSKAGFSRGDQIASAIIRHSLHLEITLDCRVVDFRNHLFEKWMKAGLKRVFLGVESGSDSVLKRMKKGYNARGAKRNLQKFTALGIDIIPGYILFEPYMDLRELRQAFDFLVENIQRLTPTKFLNRVAPYVGTEVYRTLKRDTLLRGDYPHYHYKFQNPDTDLFYSELKQSTEAIVSAYRKRSQQGYTTDSPEVGALVTQMISQFDAMLSKSGY